MIDSSQEPWQERDVAQLGVLLGLSTEIRRGKAVLDAQVQLAARLEHAAHFAQQGLLHGLRVAVDPRRHPFQDAVDHLQIEVPVAEREPRPARAGAAADMRVAALAGPAQGDRHALRHNVGDMNFPGVERQRERNVTPTATEIEHTPAGRQRRQVLPAGTQTAEGVLLQVRAQRRRHAGEDLACFGFYGGRRFQQTPHLLTRQLAPVEIARTSEVGNPVRQGIDGAAGITDCFGAHANTARPALRAKQVGTRCRHRRVHPIQSDDLAFRRRYGR